MYRPGYPKEMFSYLSSLSESKERAWDCATGNGQSAIALSEYFTEVIATDASKNQIENAAVVGNVTYQVEKAEKTSIDSNSIDVITVAQALHWFNLNEFSIEVMRVLKTHGVLAVWTYALMDINHEINTIVNHLYGSTLDLYWPPERKFVEEGYKNIKFPLQEINPPGFQMKTEWDLSQLIGYLHTWSAVKKYEAKEGFNPVDRQYKKLVALWGNPNQKLLIYWPLTLKVWKKLE